jgi:AcrR family transcriptional regulator
MSQLGAASPQYGALAIIDDESILSRLAAGELASHIAAELGVHKSAIYHRFADNQEYQRARTYGMEARLEDSETEITTSHDQFTLSRARERFRAVSWRAEREFPHRWGAKQQFAVSLPASIDAALAGLAIDLLAKIASTSRVIEHEPTEPADDNPHIGDSA